MMRSLGLFVLAFSVRILYLVEWSDTPLFRIVIGDGRAYDLWAREILAGSWLPAEALYQAPLYAYFLAGVYAVGGFDPWVVHAAQALLGALAVPLLAGAGARFFSPAVGLGAGLLLALYPPALFFDGIWQKTSLGVFLLCALLFVLGGYRLRPGAGRAALAGLLLGLLVLTRETALVFAVPILLFIALAPGTGAVRPARVAACVLGVALLLAPVFAWNTTRGGGGLTTSQLGPNLYIGNHARATGRYVPLRAGRGSARYERQDAVKIAQTALGRPLTASEVSDYWRARAFAWIRKHPAEFLRGLAYKAFLVVNAHEIPDTEAPGLYAEHSWLLSGLGSVLHFGVVFPLAMVGALALRRSIRAWWLPAAMAIALLASVALFYVFARYRMPLVPLLLPLSAAGALELGSRARLREWRPLGVALGVLLGAALLSNWPLGPDDLERAGHHHMLGLALLERDEVEAAREHYARAATLAPEFADARVGLAETLRRLGRLDEARAAVEEAVSKGPGLAGAHATHATVLAELGELEAARSSAARAAMISPDDPDVLGIVANLMLRSGQPAAAAEVFAAALAARPGDPLFELSLATARLDAGDVEAAWPLLENARRVRADDPFVAHQIARAERMRGRPSNAVRAHLRALELAESRDPRIALASLVDLAWLLSSCPAVQNPERARIARERALALAPAEVQDEIVAALEPEGPIEACRYSPAESLR